MIGLIKDGFNKVFGIIDKTVVDKDKKLELETAVKEVQINSEIEMQKLINGRTNTLLEKCISVVFPLIAFAFFLHLVTNVSVFWICFNNNTPMMFLPIDERLYSIIMVYLTGFFGSNAVGKWRNGGK